jgi:hypothetical protein
MTWSRDLKGLGLRTCSTLVASTIIQLEWTICWRSEKLFGIWIRSYSLSGQYAGGLENSLGFGFGFFPQYTSNESDWASNPLKPLNFPTPRLTTSCPCRCAGVVSSPSAPRVTPHLSPLPPGATHPPGCPAGPSDTIRYCPPSLLFCSGPAPSCAPSREALRSTSKNARTCDSRSVPCVATRQSLMYAHSCRPMSSAMPLRPISEPTWDVTDQSSGNLTVLIQG